MNTRIREDNFLPYKQKIRLLIYCRGGNLPPVFQILINKTAVPILLETAVNYMILCVCARSDVVIAPYGNSVNFYFTTTVVTLLAGIAIALPFDEPC